MPIIVDSHCDMAWNMLCFGRDYSRAAADTRRSEVGSLAQRVNGDTLIGWPDYQEGQVAIVFSTLFASPFRHTEKEWAEIHYSSPDEAHQLYQQQLETYHRLNDSPSNRFKLIFTRGDLERHMAIWAQKDSAPKPVGLIVLMEGAEGVRSVDELGEWHAQGVRLIGPCWAGTRFAGGTKEPGPLTDEGRRLLRGMAELGIVLDLSHMDERAALEALDSHEGTVVASHVNCLSLLPGFPTNRHFTDVALRGIIERGGIIGNLPVNSFLKSGWSHQNGSRRDEVSLDTFVDHIDHVCQLAGDSLHSGIGSDFDGGFGLQAVPPEIDTVADLQKVAPVLMNRGYSETDVANILGRNWLRLISRSLPA